MLIAGVRRNANVHERLQVVLVDGAGGWAAVSERARAPHAGLALAAASERVARG